MLIIQTYFNKTLRAHSTKKAFYHALLNEYLSVFVKKL